jgi:hypothetical protein
MRTVSGILRAIGLSFALAWSSLTPSLAAPITIDSTYQDNASSTCPGTALNCVIDFTLLAADEELIITQVSCRIVVTSNAVVSQVGLLSANSVNSIAPHSNMLVPVQVGANGVQRYLELNQQVLQLITPNRKPRILVSLTQGDVLSVFCNVMGTIEQVV